MQTLAICLLFLSALFGQQCLAASSEQSAGQATDQQITNLDELLASVRAEQRKERALNKQREQEFLAANNRQKKLLATAKRNYKLAQKHNNPLQKITEANAREVATLHKQLKEQTRDLGDIYSIFNKFVGDFSAVLQESMITVQFPERSLELAELAANKKLATIVEMEQLWLLVQEEMTESSKIASFDAPIIGVDGSFDHKRVLRVGTFSAVSAGEFLRYVPQTQELLALSRQPSRRYGRAAASFADSSDELLPMIIDPSHGSLLGMISYTPSLRERVEQGGVIGFIIIGLGVVGLLITLWRAIYLMIIHRRIRQQLQNLQRPSDDNPLGRVMISAANISDQEGETIQYKLDEAILAEIPKLETSHNFIKLLAVTSPLLGLLGTVTGMILTFQAISLFGSGDPKLMASGISQALVTTVLGLVVAIPILFGHNLVSALSGAMVQRLDEQSAGIMARLMEQRAEN